MYNTEDRLAKLEEKIADMLRIVGNIESIVNDLEPLFTGNIIVKSVE